MTMTKNFDEAVFQSTLSMRRATLRLYKMFSSTRYFNPRSP